MVDRFLLAPIPRKVIWAVPNHTIAEGVECFYYLDSRILWDLRFSFWIHHLQIFEKMNFHVFPCEGGAKLLGCMFCDLPPQQGYLGKQSFRTMQNYSGGGLFGGSL